MIKLSKSSLPDGIEIKSEQDYRSNPVFSLIKDDCFNKCYICEDKEPTGLQVEHRIPHRDNDKLKYDWNNLLLSCYHCNHTKGDKFDNILDCTQIDPEEYLSISVSPYPKELVVIAIKQDSCQSKETAALLERIYNGEATVMLDAECENLRNRVFKELTILQQKLIEFEDEPDLNIKEGFMNSIIKMIARSSAFAAFKREVIRNTPKYMQEFGEYLA